MRTPIQVSLETTIGDEKVEVEATYLPGYPGCWYRGKNGDPGDPPESPEVEVMSITTSEGKNIDWESLSEFDQNRIDEAVCNKAEN